MCDMTARSSWELAAGGMLLLVTAVACGSGDYRHPAPRKALEASRSGSPDEAVARVGDEQLGLASFQRYWERHPDTEPSSVVEARVDREVAVQGAFERDAVDERSLGLARKRAMVQSLLRRTVEREVTAENVAEEKIERFAEQVRRRYGRPAGLQASHIAVALPKKLRQAEAVSDERAEAEEKAREWVERMYADLPEEADLPDFFRVRDEYEEQIPGDLKVVVNAHIRFPRPSAREFKGDLPEDWSGVVSGLAAEAARLADDGEFERISEPFSTRFGWHVVRVERELEGRVPDPEALRKFATWRAVRRERRKRLEEKLRNWRQGMAIWADPGAVGESEGN